uniref:Putative a kinase anchor protein n=1 Tax=Ixodes ricinus TaxID=34613 RepID=A0A131XY22_IXORI
MDDRLKSEKELISSVLVTMQKDPMISEFLTEYRQMVEREFPFRDHGCSSVLEFFEMIRDTVTIVKRPYGEPIIRLRVDESFEHISNLVKTQKKSPVKRTTRSKFNTTRPFVPTKRPLLRRPPPQVSSSWSQKALTPTALQGRQKGVGIASQSKPVEWQHFRALNSVRRELPSPAQRTRSVDFSCQTDLESPEIFDAPNVSFDREGSLVDKEREDRLFRERLDLGAAEASGNIVKKWQASNNPPVRTFHASVESSPVPISCVRRLVLNQQSSQLTPVGPAWGVVPGSVVLSPQHYVIYNSFPLACAPVVSAPSPILQSPKFSSLNPDATEYVPEIFDRSGAELQVEERPELVDQWTSTADLCGAAHAHTSTDDLPEGILDEVTRAVKTLLQMHPAGLEVGELIGLCRLETGKDSCGETESPLEFARALLASGSSISINCFEPGKLVVKSLESGLCPDKPFATIPKEVAHGLTSILLRYPDGLDAKELLNVYRKHFAPHEYLDGASANAANFARDLLVSVPTMTVTSKGEDIFWVNLSAKGCQSSSGRNKDAKGLGLSSSIDESDTSEDESSFDKQELPQTQDFLVVIGEVFDPTEFYILNFATVSMLQSMMTELDEFYSTAPLAFYSVNRKDLKAGYACAAPYVIHGKPFWHRAVVTYVKAPKVCVRYVDYGTVKNVKIEELRRLRPDFMELPAQGIRASLANLKPKGSNTWSVEAKRRFLALTKATGLSCTVVERREDVFVIELTTALDSVSCSVGDILVEEGFARRVPKYIESCQLAEDYKVKLVVLNNVRYMTGAAISRLFGWDQNECSLRLQNLVLPSVFKTCSTVFVGKEELPELHEQICESEDSLCPSDVELYPLEQLPTILRLLEHPSKTLRREIQKLADGTNGYSSDETTHFLDISEEDGEEEECDSILRRNGKRRDLVAKLESLTERRRILRMRAYEADDREALSQLPHVERQIGSVRSLLEEFDRVPSVSASQYSMSAQQSVSSPSPVPSVLDTATASRRNSGGRVQDPDVSVSLQNKLLEMLISAKRGM